jgi:hypothetical protein
MSPSTRRLVPALVAAVVLVVVLGVLAVAGRGDDIDTDSAGAGSGSTGSAGSGSSGSDDRAGQGGMAPPSAPSAEPGGGSGGSGSDGSGSGADDPMTRFTDVRAGADGRSVDVTFYGGVDTCYRYEVRADETAQQVALSLSEQRKGDGPCIELAQEYQRSVPLDRPLGDRRVVDAATGDVLLDPSP